MGMADPILNALERASIIYNPVARNAPRRERLLAATARLRDEGWEIDLLSTEGPVPAVDLAKEVGVAKDPEQALRVLIEGEERRFDLGMAGPSAGLLRAPSTGSGRSSG